MHHLALCSLLLGILPLLTAADPADLVILIGQSNMDGRGQAADLPERFRHPSVSVKIYYRNPPHESHGWMDLGPGFSVAPQATKPITIPTSTFGPEVSFGPALKKAVPGLNLALIKASKGGTSLAKDWAPGERGKTTTQGPCYRNFLETLAKAQEALPGGPHRLRGVVWHQGESDAGLPAGMYEKLLTTFIARVREDLGEPLLPFVIGEVFDNGKRDAVRAAQQAVAAAVPHTAFVSSDDTATWDKGTHFDADSQMKIGERYAKALAKLISAAP